MKIILIAAIDQQHALGVDGDMAWHLPADFTHFKNSTLGKTIVMGHATAVSVKKALPKRRNWVLSRTRPAPYENMEIFTSVDEVLARAQEEGLDELWIVGGGVVYQEFMPLATDLIITHVDTSVPRADAHFPAIDEQQWIGETLSFHEIDDRNEHAFTIVHYRRA